MYPHPTRQARNGRVTPRRQKHGRQSGPCNYGTTSSPSVTHNRDTYYTVSQSVILHLPATVSVFIIDLACFVPGLHFHPSNPLGSSIPPTTLLYAIFPRTARLNFLSPTPHLVDICHMLHESHEP